MRRSGGTYKLGDTLRTSTSLTLDRWDGCGVAVVVEGVVVVVNVVVVVVHVVVAAAVVVVVTVVVEVVVRQRTAAVLPLQNRGIRRGSENDSTALSLQLLRLTLHLLRWWWWLCLELGLRSKGWLLLLL